MPLHVGLEELAPNEHEERHKCGHCGNEGCADLIARFMHTCSEEVTIWQTWSLYFCPMCNDITLEKNNQCSEDIDYAYNVFGEEEQSLCDDFEQLYPKDICNSIKMSSHLPEKLHEDYEEAQKVGAVSARSAAALLRLLLEKLCCYYLEREHSELKKLDKMIGFLVKEGIPTSIQQACDILRITGNEAVHPGTIDIQDGEKQVGLLFELVNMVADYLYLKYKMIPEEYLKLPEDKLKGIENYNGTMN